MGCPDDSHDGSQSKANEPFELAALLFSGFFDFVLQPDKGLSLPGKGLPLMPYGGCHFRQRCLAHVLASCAVTRFSVRRFGRYFFLFFV